jgi:putative hemolysin
MLFVFILILLNGLLAMLEIAIVSSRRARLVQLVEGGSSGARSALQLVSDATRFLSSVQSRTPLDVARGVLSEVEGQRTLRDAEGRNAERAGSCGTRPFFVYA